MRLCDCHLLNFVIPHLNKSYKRLNLSDINLLSNSLYVKFTLLFLNALKSTRS